MSALTAGKKVRINDLLTFSPDLLDNPFVLFAELKLYTFDVLIIFMGDGSGEVLRNILEGSNYGTEVPLIFVRNRADELPGRTVDNKRQYAVFEFDKFLKGISVRAAAMKDRLYVTSAITVIEEDRTDFDEVALMGRIKDAVQARTVA